MPRRRIDIGDTDPPYGEPELARVIEQAIQFIEQAERRWGNRLGLTVGEWLYVHLFESDDALLGSRDPGKETSLRKIARRSGYKPRTLRTWVWAGRMKVRLAAAGFTSDRLLMTDWAALYELRDMPEAARQVAEWVHAEDPPLELVRRYVDRMRQGRTTPPAPAPGPTRKTARRRGPDEMMAVRLVTLVLRWVTRTDLPTRARQQLLADVRALRAILERS